MNRLAKVVRSPSVRPTSKSAAVWDDVALVSTSYGVVTTNLDGEIVHMNSVAESLCGWTSKQAEGRAIATIFRLVDERRNTSAERAAARLLGGGKADPADNQRWLLSRDKSKRPIDCSAVPLRDATGQVIGTVSIFRDVTVRRDGEQKTRDALGYVQNIIATLREPFVVLDAKMRVQRANESFYRTFRVRREETEGRLIYEIGDGQWNVPRLRTLLREVLQSSESAGDLEVEKEFPAIGSRIMHLNVNAFESAVGGERLILLSIDDVTDHKRAEVAVQASENRYRQLFESAKDGILILDLDSEQIVDANPFMTELLDYQRDELVGTELWQLGFFKDKTASQVAYRQLKRAGYVRYEHLPLEKKNGDKAEVEFVSNVYTANGKSVAQCNIRDISARSRIEHAMQVQADALADLQRRKDEFLAMLSHELRSPLAPILNAVLLLRLQGSENPTQQKAVSILERQVGRMRHIVDDLLEVSRISSGRVQLRREMVTAAAVVTHAVETARPLIAEHEHELTLAVSVDPIYLNADASRLEQVVVNLLTNAAKYTKNGGHIWLSVMREGKECVITVRDNGVGIVADVLPHIFELFTQAERSLDRSLGGLGIGLALAQQLVQMHEGRLEARSAIGSGSEFIVRLPAVPSPIVRSGTPGAQKIAVAGTSLRVLVVEDNVDAARTLTMLLESSGHEVRNVFNGLAALEEALAFKPDVVLLDIGLPGLDGYKVAKWMRRTLPKVMLVAVTGYGKDEDRKRAREAGFDHHLVKPADFADVLAILATVRSKKGGAKRIVKSAAKTAPVKGTRKSVKRVAKAAKKKSSERVPRRAVKAAKKSGRAKR
jgi:PAS domain S-box-containing protein